MKLHKETILVLYSQVIHILICEEFITESALMHMKHM